MRLYIVRHAEAALGSPDALRPLTPEGREQARALGRRLREGGLSPDAILASPLLRARETAEEIARGLGGTIAAEAEERLAPGAGVDDLRAAAAGRGAQVILVGHQPDCSRNVAEITGGHEEPFPPAHVVAVDL